MFSWNGYVVEFREGSELTVEVLNTTTRQSWSTQVTASNCLQLSGGLAPTPAVFCLVLKDLFQDPAAEAKIVQTPAEFFISAKVSTKYTQTMLHIPFVPSQKNENSVLETLLASQQMTIQNLSRRLEILESKIIRKLPKELPLIYHLRNTIHFNACVTDGTECEFWSPSSLTLHTEFNNPEHFESAILAELKKFQPLASGQKHLLFGCLSLQTWLTQTEALVVLTLDDLFPGYMPKEHIAMRAAPSKTRIDWEVLRKERLIRHQEYYRFPLGQPYRWELDLQAFKPPSCWVEDPSFKTAIEFDQNRRSQPRKKHLDLCSTVASTHGTTRFQFFVW